MAWSNFGNFDNNNSDGKVSQFSEAFLKMERIHKLQDTINQCFINPLLFNIQFNLYNYEIIISCCNSLLSETYSKAPKDLKEKSIQLRKAIEKSLIKNPIHLKSYNIRGDMEIKFNLDNWNILKEWIFDYNLHIREVLGACGYDSPDKEDDDDGL